MYRTDQDFGAQSLIEQVGDYPNRQTIALENARKGIKTNMIGTRALIPKFNLAHGHRRSELMGAFQTAEYGKVDPNNPNSSI